ncbi:MAG: hypothetical protein LBV02_04995 [Bacteroidales bacterium]|nr:hypothetical protein [Bacteroidales bacterium]
MKENESFGNRENLLKMTKSESLRDFIYYEGIPEACNLMISNTVQSDLFAESVLNTIIEKDIFSFSLT